MGHARTERLDALGDEVRASLPGALGLFSFVDVLRAQGGLRRAVTDPTLSSGQRGELVVKLVDGKLDATVVGFLQKAAGLEWPSGLVLASELERQATRIALRSTDPQTVRTELNTVREAVASDETLRIAFGNPGGEGQARAQLVRELIGGRADEVTTALATRAARQGSGMLHELDEQLELTSQVGGHLLARATVARGLPSDQRERLGGQLSRIFGTQVDVVEHLDPAVLGGVRVQVGDDVIDGTVSATVDQAARELE
ncbi:MAG: F0F1 ATP synthase subunit delta [Propionibacterium sp.]